MTICIIQVIFCSTFFAEPIDDGLYYKKNSAFAPYQNELKDVPGHTIKEKVRTALPHTYLNIDTLPKEFDWGDLNGKSYLTQNLNQHVPQYCGSCWAHGTLSALADRIKIQRLSRSKFKSKPDINLSAQVLLNCASETAGSCLGGTPGGAYQWIMGNGIPFDTCQPYIACSSDSTEGFCGSVDSACSGLNICRTCSAFESSGGGCYEIDIYPNVTISEYGKVTGSAKIKTEVFVRGPVAVEINASPLVVYTGGIIDMPDESRSTNHVVSITGWGYDTNMGYYWKVRNSWGEYWGELGFFRIVMGGNQLGIEKHGYWAIPDAWTELNVPCYETGDNCRGDSITNYGWKEDEYKLNVGRFLVENANDYWIWDSDLNCSDSGRGQVLFAAEKDTRTEEASTTDISAIIIGGIIASGFFVSLCCALLGALFVRRCVLIAETQHIRLNDNPPFGDQSLQLRGDQLRSNVMYVVER